MPLLRERGGPWTFTDDFLPPAARTSGRLLRFYRELGFVEEGRFENYYAAGVGKAAPAVPACTLGASSRSKISL